MLGIRAPPQGPQASRAKLPEQHIIILTSKRMRAQGAGVGTQAVWDSDAHAFSIAQLFLFIKNVL